ncbi:hypothetical protein EniLVp02_0103 [Vibrio phage EniLVp02]
MTAIINFVQLEQCPVLSVVEGDLREMHDGDGVGIYPIATVIMEIQGRTFIHYNEFYSGRVEECIDDEDGTDYGVIFRSPCDQANALIRRIEERGQVNLEYWREICA